MINNKITALMLALTISAGGIFVADVYASTDPEAPSNITVTSGDGSVTLDWDPVEGQWGIGYTETTMMKETDISP